MSTSSNKIKTQADFYNEITQLVQSQMELKGNEPFEYEQPYPKVEKKFTKSVASLGDVYKFNQDNNDFVELLDGTAIIPSIETKGIKRDPKTGRPSSSIALKNRGDINDIFLDPSSIEKEGNNGLLLKARIKDVNYLHMTKLEDSKKYNHVSNGVINPPQSNFSVKNIIMNNIRSHERDMRKVIVYPNRVRIHHVQPEKRLIKKSPQKDQDIAQNHLMIIGKSINIKQINAPHVRFTKPKEIHYKARALSSKTARKTLLASEKFVGAMDNYFNSSEMKIPSKNNIDQIVTYAQDVEKYLGNYVSEMNRGNKKVNRQYEDPFRKKLKKEKNTTNLPPKIYPVIEDDYQKKVEEKLSRLQVELRQIFDALSQKSAVKNGDETKVNNMITKAKELTLLIKHLASDVNKSREIPLKKIQDEKQKEKDSLLMKSKSSPTKSHFNQSNRPDPLKESSSSIMKNNDTIGLYPHPKSSANNNKVIISAINPVQESMIGTSILKDSNELANSNQLVNKQQIMAQSPLVMQSITKQPHVSFGNDTITEEKSQWINNEHSNLTMSLPNYNSSIIIPSQNQQQQLQQQNNNSITKSLQTSQSLPNSLYYYSSNFKPNPLHQSLVDPNITLNNFQVEASKIKIDPIQAIRDDRFTSFNIELPVQYYFQVSEDHEPNKEREWYIRPHHTETFSKSEKAIPDDVLNTKYISFIGEAEKKETKSRQQMLEEMLVETRGHIDHLQYDLFAKCQTDKEKERLYAQLEAIKEEAQKDYVPGQFIDKEKKNEKIETMLTSGEPKSFSDMFDGNEEIKQTNFAINTFSKLLSEIRNKEQELLIKKRKEEYERIRPPMKNWYELKGTEFQNELKRNKMVINANPEYFEKIKQLTNTELY